MLTKVPPVTAAPAHQQTPAFSILSEGDDLVLHVQGALDSSTAPGIRKRLGIMRDLTGGGRLIVDLRDAHHLDPAVLDALRGAAARCREHAVEFVLRNPSQTALTALGAHQ